MPKLASPPGFTDHQKSQLEKLGLRRGQIDELEDVALPVGAAWLRTKPTMTSVRKYLKSIQSPLDRAHVVLSALRNAVKKNNAAARTAEVHLYHIAHRERGDLKFLDGAMDTIYQLARYCKQAEELLPRQSRSNAASAFPVELIWNAILNKHDLGKRLSIKPSSSPTSRFRKVVAICYEAMLAKDDVVDPERAIKAFIRLERETTRRQRANMGISVEAYVSKPRKAR